MKNDHPILTMALEARDELVALRRRFHARPELSYREHETAKFIADYLRGLGLPVTTGVGGNGVISVIEGAMPGNVIGLRADIDALPIRESSESDFKSEFDGVMHACGHDAHAAILLGTAKLLAANSDRLPGSVKLIFQPAEETVSGAKAMIDDGAFDNPSMDKIIALHVIPDIDSGHISIKRGILMSSRDEFSITITGKGGHGATPQDTIDPIVVGAQLVMAIQTIVSRKINPLSAATISVGQFVAGTQANIIPDEAYINGTIRCQDERVRKLIFEQMTIAANGVCAAAGAACQVDIIEQVPSVVNDETLFEEFINRAEELLDEDELEIADQPRNFSEDFSLFAEQVPALCFLLGTYNERKDCVYPLHNSKFKLDEDILPLGVAIFSNFCLNRKT